MGLPAGRGGFAGGRGGFAGGRGGFAGAGAGGPGRPAMVRAKIAINHSLLTYLQCYKCGGPNHFARDCQAQAMKVKKHIWISSHENLLITELVLRLWQTWTHQPRLHRT